ncbi:2Fe-2S iron-sulfur cluster-binding protein [Paenibacillus tarimensis]
MNVEVTFMPDDITVSVRSGISVLEAARKARVPIRTRCGGKAGCLMCKVTDLAGAGLSEPNENERRKLAGLIHSGTRLSCQAKVTGKATVGVPEDPLRAAVRRQLAEQRKINDELW